MKVRLFLATTAGPVRVERLTRERAQQSAVCLGRTTKVLAVSTDYDAFVRQPSGVIEREFGPMEPGAFRLDVDGPIDDGDSWQLGVFAAHMLAQNHALAGPDEPTDRAVWLTGAVHNDLTVESVDHIAEKLRVSREVFAALASEGTPLTLILPPGGKAYAGAAGLPPEIMVIEVASTGELALALDMERLAPSAGRRPVDSPLPGDMPGRRRGRAGPKEGVKRRLTTILAMDVEGYSRLMSVDEEATLLTLRAYREIIDGMIARHDGRIFNTGGDSVLAEFGSAVEAVRCAISIQEELAVRNAELDDDRQLRFRIGVNIGDVMIEREDLFGDGVNVAARLEGVAPVGGICFSGSVFEQVKNKLSMGFEDIGPQQVKNIAEPVPAFRLVPPGGKAYTGAAGPLPEFTVIVVASTGELAPDPDVERPALSAGRRPVDSPLPGDAPRSRGRRVILGVAALSVVVAGVFAMLVWQKMEALRTVAGGGAPIELEKALDEAGRSNWPVDRAAARLFLNELERGTPRGEDVSLRNHERRAPAGRTCAAVHFGNVAARLTLVLEPSGQNPTSQKDGLCGLEISVEAGPDPLYVAVSIEAPSGKYIEFRALPAVLSGTQAFTGRQSWSIDLPRRMAEPLVYRIVMVASRYPVDDGSGIWRAIATPEGEARYTGLGLRIDRFEHRVLP